MKTNLISLLASLMAISAVTSSTLGQSFDSPDALKNKALVNAPRTREAFPSLSLRSDTAAKPDWGRRVTDHRFENVAWAHSPRVLEEFPGLSRSAFSSTQTKLPVMAPEALRNRAWAASPRAREEFPWLDRGGRATEASGPIEVAPLK